MFEHHTDPVISHKAFLRRLIRGLGAIGCLIALSLLAGALGYRVFEGMRWMDAFYNAALIMSGMGPATELQSASAKIFAGLYAIYSGLFLIAATGILLVPVFHRVLHKFHRSDKNR